MSRVGQCFVCFFVSFWLPITTFGQLDKQSNFDRHFQINLEYRQLNESKYIISSLQPVFSIIGILQMRTEFEVLKPYFAKYLKTKNAKVNLVCKIEHSKLKSYVAFSSDLDKINRELVEAVRFRFVRKNLFGKIPDVSSSGLLDIDELQDSLSGEKLFKSGEELLEEILKLKDARHYHQLRYLADKHDRGILKVRFVLQPFSFVFLLTGQEQYHVVWETLDTEEAAYIWHVDKNKDSLKGLLRKIDHDLNLIRAKGRQAFIEIQPENFSKILHDYTDLRRGLIIWKDQIESRLA